MNPCRLLVLLIGVICLSPAALARGTGLVFVSNEDSDEISVLDPAANFTVVARIPTARRPRDIHFNHDHTQLLVACGDADEIDVVDLEKRAVTDRIPTGPSPELFLPTDDGRTLYVSDEENSSVEVIDAVTKKSVRRIETGPEPEGVARADGHLYVTSEMADVVHVIDPSTGDVTDNIVVGTRPRRLLVRPDAHELWVTNELSGEISVVDTRDNKVLQVLTFDPPGFRRIDVTPVGLAATHDGKRLLITLGRANHVAIVDPATRKVATYVLVGSRAWGVAISNDDRLAYVTNGLSDDVSVIDIAAGKAIASIPVGRTPHSVVVDD